MALTGKAKWLLAIPIAMVLSGLQQVVRMSIDMKSHGGLSDVAALASFVAGMFDLIAVVVLVLVVRAALAVLPEKVPPVTGNSPGTRDSREHVAPKGAD